MKWALALTLVGLVGCVSSTRVGPYVKHIMRQGDYLIIHKCVIQLESDNLSEVDCTAEQLPLRSIPVMQPGMPGQPAMPGMPAAPAMPSPPPPAMPTR